VQILCANIANIESLAVATCGLGNLDAPTKLIIISEG